MNLKITFSILLATCALGVSAQQNAVNLNYKGGVIRICDINGNNVNQAFDKNYGTDYWSGKADRQHGWVGLNLNQKHIITKVRWYNASGQYDYWQGYGWDDSVGGWHQFFYPFSCLAVFEGANEPDFSDAVPLYLVDDKSTTSSWHEAEIKVTRGFQYVRYVGSYNSHCKVMEVEFYGYEGEGEVGTEHFYQPTNLPVVVVHTKGVAFDDNKSYVDGEDPDDKEHDLPATFHFISNDGKEINTYEGTFRERGNSSRNFPKRPYRVKLDSKQKVFGSGYKAKKWTLVPAIDDQSLMRNIIGYGINERLGQEYTPYVRPVDVFVNGEYKGCYQFCDQVEANKNRIDIEEIEGTTDAAGTTTWPSSANEFGWFLELDELAEIGSDPWAFSSERLGVPVTIKSPDEDPFDEYLRNAYKETIHSHLNASIEAAYNGKMEEYYDLPSFARHFIGCEFTGNTDAYRSWYLHKHVGDDKFYSGPLWDLNLTFDNDRRIAPLNNRRDWSYWDTNWSNSDGIRAWIINILDHNPLIWVEVKDVWATVRTSGAMTKDALLSDIDLYSEKLSRTTNEFNPQQTHSAQDLNFIRWKNLDFPFFFQKEALGSWENAVSILRTCISGRVAWMDGMLGTQPSNYYLTVSGAGWSTVYLPMAFVVPEGLECFEVNGIEGNQLQLKPVTSTEANKPYLVKGAPGTYDLRGYSSVYREKNTLGLLTGTQKDIIAPAGSYVLQNQDGVVYFYEVKPNTAIKVGRNKAYLSLSGSVSAGAPARFYLDDETEGLYEMASDFTEPVRIYDMAGHLLREITEGQWSESEILDQFGRGMYIIRMGEDSKKVMIGQ